MSRPIGPGDWVECIQVKYPQHHGGYFKLGQVYRVERCELTHLGNPGLVIEGAPPPFARYPAWAASCFRPIYRRDESLINRLLAPITEDTPTTPVHEDA